MKSIFIWGTGNIANQMVKNNFNAEIIGFIQTIKSADMFMDKKVYSPNLINVDYDYIVVANTYSNEIFDVCIQQNIDLNKVIFIYPLTNGKVADTVALMEVHNILGEANYSLYCEKRGIWENTFFEKDMEEYASLNTRNSFEIDKKNLWPIIGDKYADAGTMGNYFWQDLWAAKHIISNEDISEHFDIGSRIDGFIAHLLAAGIKVNMIDIRPFPSEVENLDTFVDDATMLNNIQDDSLESLSALCSLEHFGLGRYGDPIDPEACFKCFAAIQRKMKVGGRVYISVPIGRERVEFNAHRIFYASTIVEAFSDMKLEEFSCAAEGRIEYDVDIHRYDNDPHNGEWRYGLFFFVKI